MGNRDAAGKAGVTAVLGLLMLAGVVGIYDYTAAPSRVRALGDNAGGAASGDTIQTQTHSAQPGPASGGCITNSVGQCIEPESVWADYLGYIPSGYTLAPHFPNAPTYQCPSGMDATECAVFQQSCGNAVCDPNESCVSCPIDCGTGGGVGVSPPSTVMCDPYTGRLELPGTTQVSVCQVTSIG